MTEKETRDAIRKWRATPLTDDDLPLEEAQEAIRNWNNDVFTNPGSTRTSRANYQKYLKTLEYLISKGRKELALLLPKEAHHESDGPDTGDSEIGEDDIEGSGTSSDPDIGSDPGDAQLW